MHCKIGTAKATKSNGLSKESQGRNIKNSALDMLVFKNTE